MQVILIRHGKTKANEERRYVGKTDLPLSPLGIAEIKENTYPAAQMVFASPRLRCQETARLIYPDQEIITVEGLREMDFGDFENKNHEELKNDPEYRRWVESNGTIPCPNGDSRDAFARRCVDAFHQLMQTIDPETIQTIALVVHGGTIMALMDLLTVHNGQYYDFMVNNGKGYLCQFDGEHLILQQTL